MDLNRRGFIGACTAALAVVLGVIWLPIRKQLRLKFDEHGRASVRFRSESMPLHDVWPVIADGIGRLNDSELWGLPRGSVCFSSIDWERRVEGVSTYYEGWLHFGDAAHWPKTREVCDFRKLFSHLEILG